VIHMVYNTEKPIVNFCEVNPTFVEHNAIRG